MKKLLLSVGFLSIGLMTNAQLTGCTIAPDGMYPSSIFVPVCDGTTNMVAEWGFTTDFSLVKLTQGVTYEFSAQMDGVQPYITITDEVTGEILAVGTNKVIYTANANTNIKFYSHINSNCSQNNYELIDRKVKCVAAITQYCEPVLSCADGAVIKNVKFGNLDNPSGCSTNGFNDFTTKVANVERGKTYNFEAEIGYGWHNQSVMVWIDYNKNFQFEASEFTYIGTVEQGLLSKDILIPDGIPVGDYRMRVRLATVEQNGATADKSCNTADAYGETEDYTLRVGMLSTADMYKEEVKLSPNPVTDLLSISGLSEVKEIKVINTNGQVVKKVTDAKNIDLKSLPTGVYIIAITNANDTIIKKKVIKK